MRSLRDEMAKAVVTWQHLTEAPVETADLAEEFHEASKFFAATIGRQVHGQRLAQDPGLSEGVAHQARVREHLPAIALPPVEAADVPSGLLRPPSCRKFSSRPIDLKDLSRLLWLSYGRYPSTPAAARRRPVASGGGLYPLELYVIADIGTGRRGLYHYDVPRHGLSVLRDEVDPSVLARLGVESEQVVQAPVVILVTGLFQRSRFKYGLRGYRFSLMEAGALIQQIQLAAPAYGWGSVPIAGMYDDVVEELCGIDGVDEAFINAVLLGHPAGAA